MVPCPPIPMQPSVMRLEGALAANRREEAMFGNANREVAASPVWAMKSLLFSFILRERGGYLVLKSNEAMIIA